MGWQGWLGVISPIVLLLGIAFAVLRWSHRTAHHWQKVWDLPDVVDRLAHSVEDHTTEMTQLKNTIRDRFPPTPRERRPQQWRQGGS